MKSLFLYPLLLLFTPLLFAQIPPPSFEWTRTMGGGQDDEAWTLIVDEDENVYVSGVFRGAICFGDTCVWAHPVNFASGYVAKYDLEGSLLWFHTFTGPGGGYPTDMAWDEDRQRLYICGGFSGSLRIGSIVLEAYAPWDSLPTVEDAFFMQIDTDGHVGQVHQVGGSLDYEILQQISIDENGNIYLAGYTQSDSIMLPDTVLVVPPATIGAFPKELFVASYTPDYQLRFAHLMTTNASGNTPAFNHSIIQKDEWYLLGITGDTTLYDQTYLTSLSERNIITFMLKLDTLGHFQRADITPIPLTKRKLALDEQANLYVIGSLSGAENITCYNPHGELQWEKRASGSSRGQFLEIWYQNGAIYVAGVLEESFSGDGFDFDVGSNVQDIFLIRYDLDGNVVWAKTFGDRYGRESVLAISGNRQGNLYLAGTFKGDGLLDNDTLKNIWPFTFDAWIGRLSTDPQFPVDIAPFIEPHTLLVYPNPFEDQLLVSGDFETGEIEVEIMDLRGKRIYHQFMRARKEEALAIRLDGLTEGMYVLLLRQQGRLWRQKVVREW